MQTESAIEGLPNQPTVPEPVQSSLSRRQRNAQHRHMDMEFATEIGQNLLLECRRLQSLLDQRETTIRQFNEERDGWEAEREGLIGAVRVAESSVGG